MKNPLCQYSLSTKGTLLCAAAICAVWLQFLAIRQAAELFVEATGGGSWSLPGVAWLSWVSRWDFMLALLTSFGLLSSQMMIKHAFIKGAISVASILGWSLLTNGVLHAYISISFRMPPR